MIRKQLHAVLNNNNKKNSKENRVNRFLNNVPVKEKSALLADERKI